MSPKPEQFWNAWKTEPALRELAERWLTKPDGEWADESVELYRLIDHDPDRALCDGPSCLPLTQAMPLLRTLKALRDAVQA